MPKQRRYTDEQLREAVSQATSIAGVLRILGIRQAGGSHFHMSKRIRRLNLDTSHFLGQAHSKGKQLARKPPEHYLVRRDRDDRRVAPLYLRRALLEVGVPCCCAFCGIAEVWMGMPLRLHIDHIDGDFSNCEQSNLRFLCPNCHSQTASYCRKLGSRSQQALPL